MSVHYSGLNVLIDFIETWELIGMIDCEFANTNLIWQIQYSLTHFEFYFF